LSNIRRQPEMVVETETNLQKFLRRFLLEVVDFLRLKYNRFNMVLVCYSLPLIHSNNHTIGAYSFKQKRGEL